MSRVRALVFLLTAFGTASVSEAAEKLVVFPFDMIIAKSEEDFFMGAQGPSKEEQRRLELVRDEFAKQLGATADRYQIVDPAPVAQDVAAMSPLHACNGCEIDLAKKIDAEIVMTGVIDKISETHLSLNVALVDVASSKLVKNASVLIQGNTDEAWMHGVRWLMRNRLLPEAAKQSQPEAAKPSQPEAAKQTEATKPAQPEAAKP